MSGVAKKITTNNYDLTEYKMLYESIVYLVNYERQLYSRMTDEERANLNSAMIQAVEQIEVHLKKRKSLA